MLIVVVVWPGPVCCYSGLMYAAGHRSEILNQAATKQTAKQRAKQAPGGGLPSGGPRGPLPPGKLPPECGEAEARLRHNGASTEPEDLRSQRPSSLQSFFGPVTHFTIAISRCVLDSGYSGKNLSIAGFFMIAQYKYSKL